ncbi:MAG: FecR domain-containing protein [Rhodospirillaceae bacterium]
MTPETDTPEILDTSIDRDAADWVARGDRGLSADEESRLSEWLAADVRHRGAFARAQAAYATLDRAKALGTHFTGEGPALWTPRTAAVQAMGPSRRALFAGAAAAAGLAGVLVFGPGLMDRFFPSTHPQRYASHKGEIKLVSLADKSVLTLNTTSQVTVDYTSERRSVALSEGEVMFTVAKDMARPFSVIAGEIEVRAVGTSFMVRRIEGGAPEVLVQEGVVDVVVPGRPESLLRAGANTRVTAGNSGALIKTAVSAATVVRETAWRRGMIAFEGVSLETAAEEFSRYSDTRIVIDDVTIARTTVSGLFQATNPVGFSEAVAGSLGLKAETGPGYVRVYAE